jgi:3-phenylpropionate/cinnamic acid dioxygenase small subunit
MTGPGLRQRVEEAYFLEAELLDAQDLAGWSAWLADDFRYEVPIPVFDADPSGPRHSVTGLLAVETRGSIELWQRRLAPDLVGSAYAENPPARTRHFVSNVRIRQDTDNGPEVRAVSNVLLVWNDWNRAPQMLSAERHDVINCQGEDLLLTARRVLLDSATVRLGHLRVVL